MSKSNREPGTALTGNWRFRTGIALIAIIAVLALYIFGPMNKVDEEDSGIISSLPEDPPPKLVRRYSVSLPRDARIAASGITALTVSVSPDGTHLAYVVDHDGKYFEFIVRNLFP